MDVTTKLVNIKFIPNSDLNLHAKEELEHLVKRGVLSEEILTYNAKLQDFIDKQKQKEKEREKKKSQGQSEHIKGLSEVERTQILNNTFSNPAEVYLKVPATAKLSEKEIKGILERRKPQS